MIPDRRCIQSIVKRALAEDVGRGDVTSGSLIPASARARAFLVCRAPGIIAGLPVAEEVFRQVSRRVSFNALTADGRRVRRGQRVAEIAGPVRALLAGERTALNFLQRLSGIATLTNRCVEAVARHGAIILDTRKTTPGLRALEKYAVRAGGGINHRMGLYDQVLIKDNHLMALLDEAGGSMPEAVRLAVRRARKRLGPKMLIEVEAESLDMVRAAVEAEADVVMLDNMTTKQMREAARFVRASRRNSRRPITEASGGVTPEKLPRIAATGVDAVSLGILTHSAPALDFAMDFV